MLSLTVNTALDAVDLTPLGDGVVDVDLLTPGNQISLRAAIQEANALGMPTEIILPEGEFTLSLSGAEGDASVDASVNDLDITGDITLIGAGAGRSVIDTSGLDPQDNIHNVRAFDLSGINSHLLLSQVTVTGALSMQNGTVARVQSGASFTVTDSALVANRSYWGASAIHSSGGDVQVLRSVLTNNNVSMSAFGSAIVVSNNEGYTGSLTIGESVFAQNEIESTASIGSNVRIAAGVTATNLGHNLFDDAAGGFFDIYLGEEDHLGTPDYVVTSVADTFDHEDDHKKTSVREAVDLVNQAGGHQEIWLPAWDFVLTRDRDAYGNGSTSDIDIAFGDLDILGDSTTRQNVTLHGISGPNDPTSIAWKAGITDEVFDLVGDYSQGDPTERNVDAADYTVWRDAFDDEADDNGNIDQSHALWVANYGNTLAIEAIAVHVQQEGTAATGDLIISTAAVTAVTEVLSNTTATGGSSIHLVNASSGAAVIDVVAITGQDFAGAVGNITIAFADTGTAGSETAMRSGSTLTIGIEAGTSTITQVLAAINSYDKGTTSGADFNATLTSGIEGDAFDAADIGETGVLSGGVYAVEGVTAGDDVITITAAVLGTAANGVTVTVAEAASHGTTPTAAIDGSGNITVTVDEILGTSIADITAAINSLNDYNAVLSVTDGDGIYSGTETPPAAATLSGGLEAAALANQISVGLGEVEGISRSYFT